MLVVFANMLADVEHKMDDNEVDSNRQEEYHNEQKAYREKHMIPVER